MLQIISKALSYVFHPIFIPTLIIATIAIFAPSILLPISENLFLFFSLFVFLSTWLMPALSIYGLFLSGVIKSIYLDDQRDRMIGIAVTTIIYGIFSFVLYYKFRANTEVMLLFCTSIFCQLSALIITYFWKISLHSISVWAMVCYLATLILIKKQDSLFAPLLTAILLSGALMSARLYLQKHTMAQIGAGMALSTIVSSILFFVIY